MHSVLRVFVHNVSKTKQWESWHTVGLHYHSHWVTTPHFVALSCFQLIGFVYTQIKTLKNKAFIALIKLLVNTIIQLKSTKTDVNLLSNKHRLWDCMSVCKVKGKRVIKPYTCAESIDSVVLCVYMTRRVIDQFACKQTDLALTCNNLPQFQCNYVYIEKKIY